MCSAGATGIPLPGEGTITAFLSSVRHTHWSIKALSRSASASDLSANTRPKENFQWDKKIPSNCIKVEIP
jgi:hypothetical protein